MKELDSLFDTRWQGPAIGLLDLDAFFAAVEQLDHPEWRGKPVIVGGSPDKRGVVSTASYEARVFGIHSAMRAAEARRLAPHAIWTQGNFARYRELSSQVMAIIEQETPRLEQVSIDEAFFDLSPGRFSNENPVSICKRIQSRVADLGISCSIGLGINKTVAKIASERQKPRGLTVVPPGTEAFFLAPLPVRDMSGIGPSGEKRLHALGIYRLGDLAKAQPEQLEPYFGIMSKQLIIRAAGLERSPVGHAAQAREVKSVSNERTFAQDLLEREDIERAIDYISAMVARRLRKKSLAGHSVSLKVRYNWGNTRSSQCQLPYPLDDEYELAHISRSLLNELWHEGLPVRLLGIAVSDFRDESNEWHQASFDEQEVEREQLRQKRHSLNSTTDQIRERFGNNALNYGHELRFRGRTSGTAPMNKELDGDTTADFDDD